jgi:hypothetical protein
MRDDFFGARLDGAFHDAVIIGISLNNVQCLLRLNQLRKRHYLFPRIRESSGRPMKLVAQNAEEFVEDGFGNGDFDLASSGQIKQLQRLPAKLEGADKNIGIYSDPAHSTAMLFAAPFLDEPGDVAFLDAQLLRLAFAVCQEGLPAVIGLRLHAELEQRGQQLVREFVGGLSLCLALFRKLLQHVRGERCVLFVLVGTHNQPTVIIP